MLSMYIRNSNGPSTKPWGILNLSHIMLNFFFLYTEIPIVMQHDQQKRNYNLLETMAATG